MREGLVGILLIAACGFLHISIGHHDIREQGKENTQAIAEPRTNMNGRHIVHTPRGDGAYIISICEHTVDGYTIVPPNLEEIHVINEMGIKTFEPTVEFVDPTADRVITCDEVK